MPQFPDDDWQNSLADDCRRCPKLVESRECISWGNGPLDATLVVVGEAPGAGNPDAEQWQGGNWTGMAYTSRHSGRRIRALLDEVGYEPEHCYFTNAVKCFPSDGAGSNREPTNEELTNCRSYLVSEIETIDPLAVVTTGKYATRSVLAVEGKQLDGFIDTILEPVTCQSLGTSVVPVLHPSYQDVWLSRLGYTHEEYVSAIQQALDLS